MSELKKIPIITEANMRGKTIGELSDRPNQTSRFGQGLTAQELKEQFDAFPALIKDKINDIIKMISSKDATKYIRLPSEEESSLYDFLNLFGEKQSEEDQSIADFIYAMYALKNETEEQSHSISEILDQIAKDIASLKAGGTNPPEDGGGDEGGDGGGTTPPEDGGDEGGDSGGTTPPEEDEKETYIEKTFTGASLEVPEGVAENAAIVSVGSRAKVSMNIFSWKGLKDENEGRIQLSSSQESQMFFPQPGKTYDITLSGGGFEDESEQIKIYMLIYENVNTSTELIATLTKTSSKSTATYIFPEDLSPEDCKFAKLRIVALNAIDGRLHIDPPIIVPKGEAAMDIGAHGGTQVLGYTCANDFAMPNDTIKAKCPSFGYGYSDYLNTINFDNDQYVQNVEAVKDDGEGWAETLSGGVYEKTIKGVKPKGGYDSIYCNLFRPCENARLDPTGNCISVRANGEDCLISVRLREDVTLEDFKAYIEGNLFYMIRLAEPNTVDLSELEYADPTIEVAPGALIRLADASQANYHKTTVQFLKVEEA
jgi:hypothetical protein